MDAPLLRFEDVRNAALGLHGLDFTAARGECTVLLGPEGAGQGAALRLLAGVASPDRGRILLNGQEFHRLPPDWRGFGMYLAAEALPRTRSVEDIVAQPILGLPPRLRATHVARALTLLGLDGQEAKRFASLGALQQRRVALARALAPEPSVLLLDDPLEGLDHAVRRRLALELRGLFRRIGTTVLLATRDAAEAMLLADRIVVLEAGMLAQQGTPQDLYEDPASAFVASLLGENNRLPGTIEALEDAECRVRLDCGPVVEARAADAGGPGSRCIVAVRPERVAVAAMTAADMGEGALPAVLRDVVFLGDHVRLLLEIGRGGVLVAKRPAGSRMPRPGGPAAVAWDPYAAFAFRALR